MQTALADVVSETHGGNRSTTAPHPIVFKDTLLEMFIRLVTFLEDETGCDASAPVGRMPLISVAAKFNEAEVLRYLISRGCDVNESSTFLFAHPAAMA